MGSELLYGKLNTNAQYLSSQISMLGLNLRRIMTLPDIGKEITEGLKYAFSSADIVIVTGGLGPTFDDITLEAVSSTIGLKLIIHRETENRINEYFRKRKKTPAQNNLKQALVLEGAAIFENKNGLCPAQALELKDGKTLVILPGPPHELTHLFRDYIFDYLKKHSNTYVSRIRLKISGLPESRAAERISKIIEAERELAGGEVRFSILSHSGLVEVDCFVYGGDEMLIKDTSGKIRTELIDVLGDYIFGEEEDTIESAVGKMLLSSRKTISVAESATGGQVAALLTNVPGSSIYFKGGIVSYSVFSKEKITGVDPEEIKKYGEVSAGTAELMAKAVRERHNTDLGLSVTGYAGPGGGTEKAPVGTVFCGIADRDKVLSCGEHFTGPRKQVRERMSYFALESLRKFLLKKS